MCRLGEQKPQTKYPQRWSSWRRREQRPKFLASVLGQKNSNSPVNIDRAHRSLAPRPRNCEHPLLLLSGYIIIWIKRNLVAVTEKRPSAMISGPHIPRSEPRSGTPASCFNQVKSETLEAHTVCISQPDWWSRWTAPGMHSDWRATVTGGRDGINDNIAYYYINNRVISKN